MNARDIYGDGHGFRPFPQKDMTKVDASIAKQLQRSIEANAKLVAENKDLSTKLEASQIVCKQMAQLASLTPTEQAKALDKALDETTKDWCNALEEIRRLKIKCGEPVNED